METKEELKRKKLIGEIGYFHGVKGNYNRSELASLVEKHIEALVSMNKIPKAPREDGTFWIGNYYKIRLEEIETGYNIYLYDWSKPFLDESSSTNRIVN